MGSYRQQHSEVYFVSLLVPLLALGVTIICTLTVFNFLGFASHINQISISSMIVYSIVIIILTLKKSRGCGLGFVFFPYVLSKVSNAKFYLICYFIMMFALGVSNILGFIQTLSGIIEDTFIGRIRVNKSTLQIIWIRASVCIGNELLKKLIAILLFGLLYCNRFGYHVFEFIAMYSSHLPFIMFLVFEVYYFCKFNSILYV